MSDAPKRIWATAYYNQNRSEHVKAWSENGFDEKQQVEYIRADLAAPKVKPLAWVPYGDFAYKSGEYVIEPCGFGYWSLMFYGAEIAESAAMNAATVLKRKASNHNAKYVMEALQ